MNGTGFTALVNPLGDALGEVEPRFGDARDDNRIAAFGRDMSRGATSEELYLWSRLGDARGHVYGI